MILCHSNAVLASQALHLLIQATHPDMYDWHKPPKFGTVDDTANTEDVNMDKVQQTKASCETHPQASSSRSVTTVTSTKKEGSAKFADIQKGSSSNSSSSQHPATGPHGQLWRELASLSSAGHLLTGLLSMSPDRWEHSAGNLYHMP